jgi:hypothetical protein
MSNSRQKIRNTRKYLLPAMLLALTQLPLASQANGLVLGMELSGGGDDLAVTTSGDHIKAGELLYFGAGYNYSLNSDNTLFLRSMLGFKFVAIDAKNGDLRFTRFPLDFTFIKRLDAFSLGAGPTYHLSPNYEGTINGVSSKIDFDNSLGFLVQGSYYFAQQTELGVRFTSIDYKTNTPIVLPDGVVTKKLSGNSAGIFLMTSF